jgi:hypothetical protein
LRRKKKGWSRNRDAEIRKCKHELILELDGLDALAESQNLNRWGDDQKEGPKLKAR